VVRKKSQGGAPGVMGWCGQARASWRLCVYCFLKPLGLYGIGFYRQLSLV